MKNLISKSLLITLPLLGLSTHAENLVLNGSFEEASEAPCSHTLLYLDDIALSGWEIVAGSVNYIGGYWQHASGNRSLNMNGSGAGAISQHIKTEPGTQYTVFFDLAGDPANDGTPIKRLKVAADNQSKTFTFDTSRSTRRRMQWKTDREFTFTAKKRLTELRFSSLNHASGGPALDNIRVNVTDHGYITASVKSITSSRASCTNLATGQTVSINLNNELTINCQDAGLRVTQGDIVEINIRGVADSSAKKK